MTFHGEDRTYRGLHRSRGGAGLGHLVEDLVEALPVHSESGTWTQPSDNEDSSISGIHYHHETSSSPELSQLVEDKDIAARAVAFVVSSTRKGIVPLCAEVAHIFRSKKRLEKKLSRLKEENESLRQSSSLGYRTTSQSVSPSLPHSIASFSDRASIPEPNCNNTAQEKSRPCSQCSHCSLSHPSPKQQRTSAFSIPPAATVAVLDHHPGPDKPAEAMQGSSSSGDEKDKDTEGPWKKSLPQMVSEPGDNVQKVSPTVHEKDISNRTLEEQFRQTLETNQRLAEELGAAKKEIEILRNRLKEMEMKLCAKSCKQQQYHVENECDKVKNGMSKGYTSGAKSKSPVGLGCPMMLPSPLTGCKCTACEKCHEVFKGARRGRKPHSEEETSFSKLPVEVGDHVVIKGEQTGHVRYLGHIDGIGQHSTVYAGIELDAAVGSHDGCLNDKRYFTCKRDHAVFVAIQDIVCVVNKMAPKSSGSSKKACDMSSSSSSSECPDVIKRDKYDKTRSHKKYKKYCLKLHRDSTDIQGDLV